jgi:hypothetical protein
MSCKGTHLELDVNVLQRDTPKTYVQHTGFWTSQGCKNECLAKRQTQNLCAAGRLKNCQHKHGLGYGQMLNMQK